MEKIFYTKRSNFPSSEAAVQKILAEHFGVREAVILRTENGKPYLSGNVPPLFFSVSHTDDTLFIAFSDENVGIDAELASRGVDYRSIVRKFDENERREIVSVQDFLKHFVVKESAVKWLGGTLARDLYSLKFTQGRLFYGEIELPAALTVKNADGFLIAVCSERDFENAEFIAF